MRNFFRRKPEKTNQDAQNQQNNPESNPVANFGEDHPYFKNGKAILSSDILKNEELKKKFPKLSVWLEMYPCVTGKGLYNGCPDLLKIYCFEKIHLDNSYHEFRQFALKNQINEGFNLVLKFERSVNNFKVDVGTAFTDPPFDDLTHLAEAHEYWRQARQQDFATQLIKFEVNEIVLRKYTELKQAAVHLVSLLAAIDAVTLNCIPYISFSKLMVSKEVIIQSDEHSKQLEILADKYAQQSIQSIQKIDELRARFDFVLNSNPTNEKADVAQINHEREQMQLQAFKQMLTKQYISPSNSTLNSYDSQNHFLSVSADSSFFSDFVSHPKCVTYISYKEFENNPCPETYRKLVSKIIETFSLKGEEATLATYLCSLAFSQLIAPEIFFQISDLNQSTKNETSVKPESEPVKSEENKENKSEETNKPSLPPSPAVEENSQPTPESKEENSQPTPESKEENSQSTPESKEENLQSTPESKEENSQSTPESKEENTQSTPESKEENSQPTPESKEELSAEQESKNPESPTETNSSNPEASSTLATESEAKGESHAEAPAQETPLAEETKQQDSPKEAEPKISNESHEAKNESPASPQVETVPQVSSGDKDSLEQMQSIGFDVFIQADPILTLRAISNNMNVEYSTEGSVKYIIDCLKMITPKWKEILKFSVDCSIQEYLPPKLRSIRYVINEIVSM